MCGVWRACVCVHVLCFLGTLTCVGLQGVWKVGGGWLPMPNTAGDTHAYLCRACANVPHMDDDVFMREWYPLSCLQWCAWCRCGVCVCLFLACFFVRVLVVVCGRQNYYTREVEYVQQASEYRLRRVPDTFALFQVRRAGNEEEAYMRLLEMKDVRLEWEMPSGGEVNELFRRMQNAIFESERFPDRVRGRAVV